MISVESLYVNLLIQPMNANKKMII